MPKSKLEKLQEKYNQEVIQILLEIRPMTPEEMAYFMSKINATVRGFLEKLNELNV